jgi:hypothetical protein
MLHALTTVGRSDGAGVNLVERAHDLHLPT